MKRIIAATLLATASLMAHTGASAQTKLRATIPFDFTVGNDKLPAGTYEISHVGPQDILIELPTEAQERICRAQFNR